MLSYETCGNRTTESERRSGISYHKDKQKQIEIAGFSDERTISGIVIRVVYHNDNTGWAVFRIRNSRGTVDTIVGSVGRLNEGEEVEARGEWVDDPRYGSQFKALSIAVKAPSSINGLKRYLSSGAIRGIGTERAARIVGHFGPETEHILTNDPERLTEIRGIGIKTASSIAVSWRKERVERTLMIHLFSLGLGRGFARRIIRRYGSDAPERIRSNPYLLAEEVDGIGFRTADTLASEIGIARDSPFRIKAGIIYAMRKSLDEGHTFLPRDEIETRVRTMLDIDYDSVHDAVDDLIQESKLKTQKNAIFLPDLLHAEVVIADRIKRHAGHRGSLSPQPAETSLLTGLDTEQKAAVFAAFEKGLVVVTGGPGTGKTTLIRHVCRIASIRRLTILLCAPTGRAARRLQETTGRTAKTIHRLLEFDPETMTFGRNESLPLECDILVVDETSMVDLPLMANLVAALPDTCSVLLVGDVDQLPPVGPGAVLRELIFSGAVPVVRLVHVYRQALNSLIVVNAHRVNRGLKPVEESAGAHSDFFWIKRTHPEELLQTLLIMVSERIPTSLGVNPLRDIQVLVPMHRGILGTRNLNQQLQNILNPTNRGLKSGDREFRIGDRVMQTKNDYQRMVFNGEQGWITDCDTSRGSLTIAFQDQEIDYPSDEIDKITLSYASTVHKAQGSEFPVIVFVMHTQHYIMLRRNLLYTGITRGKKMVILLGNDRAVNIAVKNDQIDERYCSLGSRLVSR